MKKAWFIKVAEKLRKLGESYMIKTLLAGAALALALVTGAQAATLLDDFNDTNGSNWMDLQGTTTHNGTTLTGTNNSVTQLIGAVVDDTTYSVDVDLGSRGYVAIALGLGTLDNYYVKIQRNGGTSYSFGFYTGYNNTSGGPFISISDVGQTGNFAVTLSGNSVTASYNGETLMHTYGSAFTGTGIGLGIWDNGAADNFMSGSATAPVPLPATGLLLLGGLGALAFGRRRAKS